MAVRRRSLICALLALAVSLIAVSATATAIARRSPSPAAAAPGTPVPQGFVGVDVDGPLVGANPPISLARQLPRMVTAGVQTIRVAFDWAAGEPYASWSAVPAAGRDEFQDVDGMPVDFSATDSEVAAAARYHVGVLPTVLYAPDWDGVPNPAGVEYPRRDAPYAAYLTALIGRYGPRGSFWRANPGVPREPIREWQIWNEPNLLYYWGRDFAPGYDALLSAAHAAVHRADPGARVVLGALTNRAWTAYGTLYRADHRIADDFEIASVNGFTELPANVIVYLQYMRHALDRTGAIDKPLIATEVSWPAALGQTSQRYSFDTTPTGQARDIAALLPLLGAHRAALELAGFDYYTWMGAPSKGGPAFPFAGLLDYAHHRISAKPALGAFRTGALRLEGCRSKGSLATSCLR